MRVMELILMMQIFCIPVICLEPLQPLLLVWGWECGGVEDAEHGRSSAADPVPAIALQAAFMLSTRPLPLTEMLQCVSLSSDWVSNILLAVAAREASPWQQLLRLLPVFVL